MLCSVVNGYTVQKTTTEIFIRVRTSNLTQKHVTHRNQPCRNPLNRFFNTILVWIFHVTGLIFRLWQMNPFNLARSALFVCLDCHLHFLIVKQRCKYPSQRLPLRSLRGHLTQALSQRPPLPPPFRLSRAPRRKLRADVIICRAVEAGQQVASHLSLTCLPATGKATALTKRSRKLNKGFIGTRFAP
jgi:hypothetical protein